MLPLSSHGEFARTLNQSETENSRNSNWKKKQTTIFIFNPYTLPLAYFYYVFVHCVVRAYDLNCVANANQRISTECKIHEYSQTLGRISALTNQIMFLFTILKCVDAVEAKSSLKFAKLLYH